MEFKERLEREKAAFRADLEGQILVQWKTKVKALWFYVDQLNQKIESEQLAREKLTLAYE